MPSKHPSFQTAELYKQPIRAMRACGLPPPPLLTLVGV